MLYAALISLSQTLQSLLNSSHVSISQPSRELLDAVYEEALLVKKTLKHMDFMRMKDDMDADELQQMNAFETEMKEAACSLEDALETHLVDLYSQSDSHEDKSPIHLDMTTELKRDIDSFTRKLKQYTDSDEGGDEEEEDDDDEDEDGDEGEDEEDEDDDDDDDDEDDDGEEDDEVTSRIDFGRNKSKRLMGRLFDEEEEEDDDDDEDEDGEGEEEEEEEEDDDDDDDDEDDDGGEDDEVTSRIDFGGNKSKRLMGRLLDEEEEEEDASRIDFGKKKSNMFRFSEEEEEDDDDNHGDDDDLTSMTDFSINRSKMIGFPQEEKAKVDDDDDGGKSRIHLSENKSKMVGFTDIFHQIKDHLLRTHWSKGSEPRIEEVSLVGMAGIGKTTLAKEVYADPSVMSRFNHRAWVNIGQKYQFKDILQSILSQVSPGTKKMLKLDYGYRMRTRSEEKDDDNALFENLSLASKFYEHLDDNRRYLIVLDDVWDTRILQYFQRLLPYYSNYEILVLSTTRLDHLGVWDGLFRLQLMNTEESWDLLRTKMFGAHGLCPPHLEKAGKKIAENCEGLPLTIVTVADILSKADEMIPEYWNKVAEKESSVFRDAYDRISEVLYPSYKHLRLHFKAIFLYMAVFPQNYKISVTRIGLLWDAEGFLEPYCSALTCIEDFVLSSLVLDVQSSYNYRYKVCTVHSVFWHLCVREARKNKLFHVLRKYADSLAQDIRNQRRLCIHNNVLFGIKDARESMSSISTARSLLCTGTFHKYPVPVCFDLRLLRVIDALTIRFYEFPTEVLKLVRLRYLGLICEGKLPESISNLWNLQFLIVHRYLSMTELGKDESYLPVEIWDMKELKHLQVTGSNLPDPRDGALLPNLETLLDVSPRSCTKGVLEGLPKLEKLGVRIELSVHVDEPFSCFDHISHFSELQSIECVVVNPELGFKAVAPPASSSLFPECLYKLSLSGCGYSWEDMKAISSITNLQVLKLRCYAFRGSKWEIKAEDFPSLQTLLIEDTDLVQWIVGSGSFRWLKCLVLKNCYKLEEIHGEFGNSLRRVEITDCSPFAVNYAKQLQKDNSALKLSIHSSWEAGKFKYSKLG